jgi:hypothetical protein
LTLTATGTLTGTVLGIGNLPVAAAGSGTMHIAYFAGLGVSVVHLAGYISGTAAFLVYTTAAAAASSQMVLAHATNTTSLIFSGSYIA